MAVKPASWYRFAIVLSVLNIGGAGFAIGSAEPMHAAVHVALAGAFAVWARRMRQGPVESGSGSEMDRMKQLLAQQAKTLDDMQSALSSQSTELVELQERVDFAERLLAQARDRQSLGPREERG